MLPAGSAVLRIYTLLFDKSPKQTRNSQKLKQERGEAEMEIRNG